MSTFQENQKAIDEFRKGQSALPEPPEIQKQEGLSLIETLSLDNNYEIIKDYMSDRFGMEDTEYDKREIIDSYINLTQGKVTSLRLDVQRLLKLTSCLTVLVVLLVRTGQ